MGIDRHLRLTIRTALIAMAAGGERSGVVIYQGRGVRLLRAFTRVKTCCS